ncbi:hypothetical protein ACFC1R_08615 [Kitasatospora sp. NPDC056138]|uniref:hypothetical protein n=1 Tax=Kitasatospora sp. NPDC056138 TaxID=3345724 RepID=UPI0035DD767C
MLLAVIVVMGLLAGAAIHTSLPVFLTASAAIAAWLLTFAAREHLARTRTARSGLARAHRN